MRHYIGNEPTDPKWIRLDVDMSAWRAYLDTSTKGDKWVKVKVASMERLPKKANYWTAVYCKDRRVAMSKDMQILQEHRPEVFDFVSIDVVDAVVNECSD